MRRIRFIKLGCLLASLLLLASLSSRRAFPSEQSADEQLAQQAFAIVQTRCLQCHGAEKMSGLDLRTREGLLKGGQRGPAIVLGESASSRLYQMITGEAQPRMPLDQQLSADQIAILKTWIDRGAPWPSSAAIETKPSYAGGKPITDADRNYWAFRKAVRPEAPRPKLSFWVRNPIDAFILAALERRGLKPSPPADRRTLLRRVTLDLTGLPPTLEESEAFLSDQSPDAYEKVVRRLLASPRYGERWAQHWLDVARFAETNGFELDQEREQSWRYRDYVVRAFNEDRPYDRFIIEQIAGDELAPTDFEMRLATGFMRGGPQHVVAGNQDLAVNRQEWLTEATLGVANTFLGLTIGCARCHDHKFDPIPQADYYRLQAFFAATDNFDYKNPAPKEKETYEAALKAHKERLKPITDQIAAIEKPYRDRLFKEKFEKLELEYARALATEEKQRTPEQQRLAKDARNMLEVKWDELVASLTPADRERRAALRRQMHALELEAPPPLPAALGVADTLTPTPASHIFRLGDPHAPGPEVQPRFLSVLLAKDAPPMAEIPRLPGEMKTTGRRTALARWLAQPDHPLTARVMMNRLWQHHFGRGMVATPNDFGRHGQQPTHAELLDWLATEFVARGWSLKAMHELMVLSNTYRQSSTVEPVKAKIDPDNHLLWRQNRQRLDAEALRDSVLAVAGTLTLEMGGPPIRVPLEPEVYDTIFTEYEPDNLWPVTPDVRQHTRRSLYLFRKRNVRLPMLVAFDAPDMMSSCAARNVSVHSLQSLTLMNSDFIREQSRALASRVLREAQGGERASIERLYLLTLNRPPNAQEMRITEQFLRDQVMIIRQRIAEGERVAQLTGIPEQIDRATAAAWVDLCLATLNLNEFVYVR
jgi:mono/diheme cytochrome c family protein